MAWLSNIPPFPVPADRAAGTYNSKAVSHGLHMGNVFVPEMNALQPIVESAASASAAAIAAANFKGLWSSLSGPLAVPATVVHANQRWLLTESVADVTAHTPGVSSKWLSLTGQVELIGTTNAAGVASVEWTNFDTLAGIYAALRIVADGIVGSAATADLKGYLRQNGAWVTDGSSLYLSCSNMGGSIGGDGLNAAGALKNVAAQAITLEMDITGLGRTARPNVRFSSMGGTHSGGDSAAYWMYGGVTSSKSWTPTTPPQGLRIFASTGNVSGTFRLYGVRK